MGQSQIPFTLVAQENHVCMDKTPSGVKLEPHLNQNERREDMS